MSLMHAGAPTPGSLEPVRLAPPEGRLVRWAALLPHAAELAAAIAGTDFVPRAMRGKPEAVTAAILYGDELGIEPMQALAGIHVVEGKPYPSAELMRALILARGHSFRVHRADPEMAQVSGLRAGDDESLRLPVKWTIRQARDAHLLGKDNWRKYPQAMLLARATSDLARLMFPDVIKGLSYVAEDVGSAEQLATWLPEGELPETGTRRSVQRRTPPRSEPAAVAATEPPAPATEAPTDSSSSAPDDPTPPDEGPPSGTSGAAAGDPTAPREPPAPRRRPVELTPDYSPEARGVRRPRASAAERAAHTAGPVPGVQDVPLPEPDDDPVAEQTPVAEQPDDAPVAAVPMGVAPFRAMQATLGRILGPQHPRERRLALLSAIVKRPLETSKELTRDEGYTVLGHLARIDSGLASWVELDDGSVELREHGASPPTDDDAPPDDDTDPWGARPDGYDDSTT